MLDGVYRDHIGGEVSVLTPRDEITQWAYHLFVIRVRARDRIMEEVQRRGTGVGVHFRAVYRLKYYQEKYQIPRDAYPVAERASEEVLSLPLYPSMEVGDVHRVLDVLRKVLYDFR